MQRTSEEKTELFERTPIRQAALTLIVPTVISQLVVLVYNMADTWFIGQTGDPHQVAAVTVTYPIFMMMIALILYRNIHKQPQIEMKKVSGGKQ